jgi:hypothetical protein
MSALPPESRHAHRRHRCPLCAQKRTFCRDEILSPASLPQVTLGLHDPAQFTSLIIR